MFKCLITFTIAFAVFSFAAGAPDCSKKIEPGEELEKCCDIPKWEEKDDIEAKCRSGPSSCVAECFLNSTDVMTAGKVDMAKVQASIAKDMADYPEFVPIMTTAFEMCTAKLQRMTTESTPTSEGCNPYFMVLLACVHTQYLANCPPSKWTSSKECNEAREYVNLCL